MSEVKDEALMIVGKQIDDKLQIFEEKIKGGFDVSDIKADVQALTTKYAEMTLTKDAIEKLSGQMDAIQAAQKSQGDRMQARKSFTEVAQGLITEKSAQFEQLKTRDRNRFRFDIEDGQSHIVSKAVGTVTLSNVTGALPTSMGQLVDPLSRKLHIRSLIPNSPMTAATYSYPVVVDGEGAVAIQTEGSAKAQTDVDVTYEMRSPVEIAHFQRHSEQVLQDIPFLLSFVSNRMVEQLLNKEDNEILLGAGGSNRLSGILTGATAYAPTGSANVSTANRYSYLFNAISQLAQADVSPNGILINPYAYYEMLQIRTTALEYTAPVAGITFANDTLRFAGVPVYQSTAMATNSFCVGDWMEADFLTRSGITVDLSREDADNFTKNLVTVRVEERVGLAVYRPTSFIYGSFDDIAS